MSEMSDTFNLVDAVELAKEARVGMELTYFDVVALIDDLREENANLTARIAELEAAQRWIPVSERLPKIYQAVNVVDAGEVDQGIWDGEMFEVSADHQSDFGASHFENVTHWMPLPEAPEVQE